MERDDGGREDPRGERFILFSTRGSVTFWVAEDVLEPQPGAEYAVLEAWRRLRAGDVDQVEPHIDARGVMYDPRSGLEVRSSSFGEAAKASGPYRAGDPRGAGLEHGQPMPPWHETKSCLKQAAQAAEAYDADYWLRRAQVQATLTVAHALDRIEIELRQISGPLGLSIDGERAFYVRVSEGTTRR